LKILWQNKNSEFNDICFVENEGVLIGVGQKNDSFKLNEKRELISTEKAIESTKEIREI
jgi:hypothetical protein